MNSKTGEKVFIHFKDQFSKDETLKVLSDIDLWDTDEYDIIKPTIPVINCLPEISLSVKGIYTSKTFYFKEISRHITVQKKPIW